MALGLAQPAGTHDQPGYLVVAYRVAQTGDFIPVIGPGFQSHDLATRVERPDTADSCTH